MIKVILFLLMFPLVTSIPVKADDRGCPLPIFKKTEALFEKIKRDPPSEVEMAEFTKQVGKIVPYYQACEQRACDEEKDSTRCAQPRIWFDFIYMSSLNVATKFLQSKPTQEVLDQIDNLYDAHNWRKQYLSAAPKISEAINSGAPTVGFIRDNGGKIIFGFVKTRDSWVHFSHYMPLNLSKTWHVVFDGKSRDTMRLKNQQNILPATTAGFPFTYFETQLERTPEKVPSGFDGVFKQKDNVLVNRPLVIVNRDVTDPEGWHPVENVSDEILQDAAKVLLDEPCIKAIKSSIRELVNNFQLAKGDRNLNFKSKTENYFLQFQATPKLREQMLSVACEMYENFHEKTRFSFLKFKGSRGRIIGTDMNMIEAADFDNDGKSELVLSGFYLLPINTLVGHTASVKSIILASPSQLDVSILGIRR